MGSIERRIQWLEDLYYCTTAAADLEERRRRAGTPPLDEVLTSQERTRAHQHFKQALRRKAGLE